MNQNLPQQSIALGALYTTLAMAVVAILGALVKWTSHGFSSEFLMVVRWGAGLLILCALYLFRPPDSLRSEQWLLQCGIAASWTAAIFIYYLSIRFISLMDATLLLNTAAIFAPVLNFFLDKKREPAIVWVGTLIGFLGVVIVLKPGPALLENPYSLVGLGAGMLIAIRIYLTSKLKNEPAHRTTFYSLLAGFGLCLALLAFSSTSIQTPDWQATLFSPRYQFLHLLVDSTMVVVIIAFGLLSIMQPWLTSSGLSYASVGQISPFRYTAVLFAGVLDWAFWGVVPTWTTCVGLALVVAGGLTVIKSKR